MNAREARALLSLELARWRERSYDELVSRIDAEPVTGEITGPPGVRYQFEIQVFWDAKPGGVVRVLGSIDDGGLRAFAPVSDGFLMRADGTFAGEDA